MKKHVFRSFFLQDENVDKEIKCRYQYSKYVIDPNRFRFWKVVRVLALIFTFIKKISKNIEKMRGSTIFKHDQTDLAKCLENKGDQYILTTKTVINMNSKAS